MVTYVPVRSVVSADAKGMQVITSINANRAQRIETDFLIDQTSLFDCGFSACGVIIPKPAEVVYQQNFGFFANRQRNIVEFLNPVELSHTGGAAPP